jgi:hypothetical protein
MTFRDDQKNIIKHSDPDLENKARYVMVRFEAQKNREKCDVRTAEKHSFLGSHHFVLVRVKAGPFGLLWFLWKYA